MSNLISVVEVVRGRVIIVYSQLHHAQAQNSSVEVYVCLRVSSNRGNVVDARNQLVQSSLVTVGLALKTLGPLRRLQMRASCLAVQYFRNS